MNNAAVSYVPLGAAGTVAVNVTGTSGTPTTEVRMVVVTVNTGATNIVDSTDVRGVVLGYYD